jgi:hypothetical protein
MQVVKSDLEAKVKANLESVIQTLPPPRPPPEIGAGKIGDMPPGREVEDPRLATPPPPPPPPPLR